MPDAPAGAGGGPGPPDPARSGAWRLLRRLLPRWYRERYGDSLVRLHAARAGWRGGRGIARARFWAAVAWDAFVTGVQTRVGGDAAEDYGNGTGTATRAAPGNATDGGRTTMSLSGMVFDLRVMSRALLRKPGYAATVVGILGLGIGVAAATFSLVHASLLRPLPYPEPDRVVQVRDAYRPTGGSGGMSPPNYLDLRERARTLESFAAYAYASLNMATEASPERVAGISVTPDFLPTLRVRPAVGRSFRDEEGLTTQARVALVSHRIWEDRFGGGDLRDRTVRLNGEPFDVVGVLPADFWFPGDPEILVPLGWDTENTPGRGSRQIEGLGRLAEGTSLAGAESELRSIFSEVAEEFPQGNDGWTVRLLPMAEYALGRNRDAFRLLGGAALFVLLIGCVNVANLMLVRAERRQRETAVRAALGAGRRRIGRHFLGESLLLTAAAWVLGLGVAWVGSRALVALWGSGLPRASDVAIDGTVLAFTAGLALAVALVVGLVPTLRTDMRRIYGTLREGGFTGSDRGRTLQKVLVGAEVALSVMLVAGAALLLHSSWKASRIDTGVDLEKAVIFRVQVPSGDSREPADIVDFYRRAVTGIGRISGVEAVGITDRPPLLGGYNITTLQSPVDPELESSFVEIRRVTPGFFQAAGIPLLRGRSLDGTDGTTEAQVVVISDRLAEDLFPDGNAVGQRINPGWNEEGYEVVGVVGSVREWGILGQKRPALYWPYPVPNPNPSMTFVMRTAGDDPLEVIPDVRAVLADIDPTIPIYSVATLEDVATGTLGSRRLATNLFATFGVLALVLAAAGIFGVLAYSVEQRTREIGIRIAIGAGARRVIREVVVRGLRLVVVGLVVGVAGALLGTRLLADLLYAVEPRDALTLSAVVAVVLGTSLLATWLPARRAARIEPSIALRTE